MKLLEITDWDSISDDDLHEVLVESRDFIETLSDSSSLNRHFLWDIVRNRTVTSLYFLNKFCWDSSPAGGPDTPISENLMTLENHQHVIDMFVKKDPTKSLANQSKIKNRLILYPRGSLKSSWGMLDVIQWVLLDYKIRILVLSAADDLASGIVDEVRGYFTIKEAKASLMNLFWPEHCLLEKDLGPSGQYTTPQWAKQQSSRKEPTIMSRGVTSSVSGFHFEVFHGDDIVETRNSSDEQCIQVRKKYGITRKVLRTFGYVNLLGTRYHEDDLYGDTITKAEMGDAIVQELSISEKKISNPGKGVEILIGAAMTIKPEAEVELAKYNLPRELWFRKAGPLGVHLLMPKVLSYDTQLVIYEDDPVAYETQMRQNVTPPTQQMFTREMILKNTVNWDELPVYGRVTHTWDLNGGKGKKDNDMCVGTACLWDSKGTGFIIDLVVANFPNPISIAQAIVQFAVKHHPDVVSIEDALGCRMLEPTIWAEADKTDDKYVQQLVRRVYWRPVDTNKDAKKNRITSLYPLVLYGRIKFATTLHERERMIDQFIRPVTKASKNDIPDCISFQTAFMPPVPLTADQQKIVDADMKLKREQSISKSTWEMLFSENQQIYSPVMYEVPKEEMPVDSPMPYANNDGLDNILGFGLTG